MLSEWVLLCRKKQNSMDPVVGASIISTVGSGIANLTGAALERRSQKKQQELAREQSLQDRAHNEWYNSPAQQRERLRQAGIGISNDTVKADDTSSENMQYAQPYTNDILNSRSTGLQQLAAAPAEAMKFALDIAEQTSKIKGLNTDNDLKNVTLQFADENARLALDKGYNELAQGVEQLKVLRSTANLNKKNAKLLDIQIEYGDRLMSAKTKIAECEAAIAENNKKISDETVDAEIAKSWTELEQAFANVRLTQTQISECCAKIANLNAQTNNLQTTGQILLETLSQEQLKTEFDGRTLEERIRGVTVGVNLTGQQVTGQRLDNEKSVRDAQVYGVQRAFDCLTGLLGLGINSYNARTQRMIGNSVIDKNASGTSTVVGTNGRPFVTKNGKPIVQ